MLYKCFKEKHRKKHFDYLSTITLLLVLCNSLQLVGHTALQEFMKHQERMNEGFFLPEVLGFHLRIFIQVKNPIFTVILCSCLACQEHRSKHYLSSFGDCAVSASGIQILWCFAELWQVNLKIGCNRSPIKIGKVVFCFQNVTYLNWIFFLKMSWEVSLFYNLCFLIFKSF